MMDFFEQLGSGRSFSPASVHPNGLPSAVRTEPPSGVAQGFEDAFLSSSDFLVTVKQIEARHTFHDDEPGLGRLVFVFHLSGRREVELGQTGRHELKKPTFAAYYQAEGVSKRSIWNRGEQETAVLIGFWPKRPPQMLKEPLSLISDLAEMGSDHGRSIWVERPLTFAMEQAAQQIITPKVHSGLLHDFLWIKANELLCLGIDAILSAQIDGNDPTAAVCGKIIYAQSLLDSSLQNPPALSDLARAVALSPASFSAEFREATGLSIGQYVGQKRMEKSRYLLESTAMPLKQIAFELGYNHTSNFCLAFKRHFGMTAGEIRDASRRTAAPGQC